MNVNTSSVAAPISTSTASALLEPRPESPGSAAEPPPFHGMVGNGPQMQSVFGLMGRIAPHFSTVLVTGETGTGKELVARALHNMSPARRGHMVVLNCSAVVETLFESELFGHVRGAFTGATSDKVGLLEFANGGTLFLDEIGDMPLSTQAKLLRVLQSREVQRVGGLSTKKVDFRLVAATNKDLRKAVADKQFRGDLFYRLSMVEVELPPLRDRIEDLHPLIAHFIQSWSMRFGKHIDGVSANVMRLLEQHEWPGNIRELENALGHACMMSAGPQLQLRDFPTYLSPIGKPVKGRMELPSVISAEASDAIEDVELRLVRQALQDTDGNQVRAARLLHTTRDRLRYRMKKYGLAGEKGFAATA